MIGGRWEKGGAAGRVSKEVIEERGETGRKEEREPRREERKGDRERGRIKEKGTQKQRKKNPQR